MCRFLLQAKLRFTKLTDTYVDTHSFLGRADRKWINLNVKERYMSSCFIS